jgi:hypothetical protein
MCPNNDGGSSLPNRARIKLVIQDASGNPMPGIAAADMCLLFNGGTPGQGFSGIGSPSIIANSTWNPAPFCPDVRCVEADAPTDANGVAYITFTGADPANPGVGRRDPNRKWGHYDADIPVYVLGFRISGQLTSASPPNTYNLSIKNYDHVGGLDLTLNAGAVISSLDLNSVVHFVGSHAPQSVWRDFDSSGAVDFNDLTPLIFHFNHDCDAPNDP